MKLQMKVTYEDNYHLGLGNFPPREEQHPNPVHHGKGQGVKGGLTATDMRHLRNLCLFS